MARSIWKGPFVDSYLIKKVENMRNLGKSDIIQTYSRRSTIIPEFIGITFGVHNGQKNVPVSITEDMIGKKLGEFSPTRTFKGHGADKKSKR